MTYSKRKLTVFLADLTHTGIRIATENIPLNIGLLASYVIKQFGSEVQVRLFKYPDKLFYALQNEKYDILGCSTYIWNNNLSEWACEMAKKFNPNVVTVRGGWNFPLEEKQQEEYLRKHPFTDIFCLNEGEKAFANIIERLLSVEKIKHWNDSPLAGCVFLNSQNNGVFTKGPNLLRMDNLDAIPSPYTTGLLDEFFDGKLTPIIETTRGCPFRCNYCNSSNDYYSRVRFFSVEYSIEEIKYISKKIVSIGIKNLIIADTNFGMYSRDKEIALVLGEARAKFGWPLGIGGSTGKNNIERVIDTTDVLGAAMSVSMSVQSMNPITLKDIKRDNISLKMYEEISKAMSERGRPQFAELIVPLPEETFASYMEGIEKLINIGAKKFISLTLQMNNGTIYKNEEYRKRYGYVGKFRLVPNDFGTYGDRRVFDYEEVATFSNTIDFNDYLEIRKFTLTTELLFNNTIFLEVFRFLNDNGISNLAYLKYVLNRLKEAPLALRNAFEDFLSETKNELKDSEEELIRFYSEDSNFERLKAGEIGGNVLYRHTGIILGKYMSEWRDYIFNCAKEIVNAEGDNKDASDQFQEVEALKSFVEAKLDGLFSPDRTSKDIFLDLKWDILAWLKDKHASPLKNYLGEEGELFTYRFYFDENQKYERNDLFTRYGENISGLTKIMQRVPALERLFRKVEKVKKGR